MLKILKQFVTVKEIDDAYIYLLWWATWIDETKNDPTLVWDYDVTKLIRYFRYAVNAYQFGLIDICDYWSISNLCGFIMREQFKLKPEERAKISLYSILGWFKDDVKTITQRF